MGLHIGREIEEKYKESGIKLSEFAKRLNTSPRNIYDIFERSDIKTDQLKKISEVLNYNFFLLYNPSSSPNSITKEPEIPYTSKKVSVVVELDGTETTLNQWIQRLSAINKAMN
jgi:hypothetical protein